MRKSISIATDFARVSTTASGPQPPRGWMEALDHPRGEKIRIEVLVKALLDAGTQNLDGDWL